MSRLEELFSQLEKNKSISKELTSELRNEIEKITSHKNHTFKHLYIFSHDNLQYQLAAKRFPNLKVIRLYESQEINR